MRISVDRDRCIGVGNCVEVASAYFDQSKDDGIVVLLQEEVAPGDEEAVEQAVEVCPVQAILLNGAGS